MRAGRTDMGRSATAMELVRGIRAERAPIAGVGTAAAAS